MSYPQSLLQIKPQKLIEQLESTGPIAEATVTRHLLPPSITIEVRERRPVAIATSLTAVNGSKPREQVGFLDEQGIWMPKSSYTKVADHLELPTLKMIGFGKQNRPYWSELYQIISRSTVKISEIDWQNPRNLLLKTELGNVHVGADISQLSDQLAVLARMRQLPAHLDKGKILYIDLTNPKSPSVQLAQGKSENLKPQLRLNSQMSSLP